MRRTVWSPFCKWGNRLRAVEWPLHSCLASGGNWVQTWTRQFYASNLLSFHHIFTICEMFDFLKSKNNNSNNLGITTTISPYFLLIFSIPHARVNNSLRVSHGIDTQQPSFQEYFSFSLFVHLHYPIQQPLATCGYWASEMESIKHTPNLKDAVQNNDSSLIIFTLIMCSNDNIWDYCVKIYQNYYFPRSVIQQKDKRFLILRFCLSLFLLLVFFFLMLSFWCVPAAMRSTRS